MNFFQVFGWEEKGRGRRGREGVTHSSALLDGSLKNIVHCSPGLSLKRCCGCNRHKRTQYYAVIYTHTHTEITLTQTPDPYTERYMTHPVGARTRACTHTPHCTCVYTNQQQTRSPSPHLLPPGKHACIPVLTRTGTTNTQEPQTRSPSPHSLSPRKHAPHSLSLRKHTRTPLFTRTGTTNKPAP